MIINNPKICCDICKSEINEFQGYGLRGAKNTVQYTKDLTKAEMHICNGCILGFVGFLKTLPIKEVSQK